MPDTETPNRKPLKVAHEQYTAEEAAEILILLGEEPAAGIIKYLSPREIRIISEQTEKIKFKSRDDIHRLLQRFEHDLVSSSLLLGNHQAQMRQTLQKALGREQARCLFVAGSSDQEQLTGLQLMKPELLAAMIHKEPVQFQAAVLACLQTDQASEVIALYPEAQGEDILERIARLNQLPKASIQAIIDLMDDFLNEQTLDDVLPIAGEQQAANILNLSDNKVRDRFLQKLKENDITLAERIEEQMLIFEHIVYLSKEGLRLLLGNIEQDQLALALKGESDEIKERVFATMSKRAADYLKEEINIMGAVHASKVKTARQGIIQQMDEMLKSGDIEMSRGGEEMVE